MLDTGNAYRSDIEEAEKVLSSYGSNNSFNLGGIGFESDDDNFALQAADVVSWSVRRRLSTGLKSGFEPLQEIFDSKHEELAYKGEWMMGVADIVRARETRQKAG